MKWETPISFTNFLLAVIGCTVANFFLMWAGYFDGPNQDQATHVTVH